MHGLVIMAIKLLWVKGNLLLVSELFKKSSKINFQTLLLRRQVLHDQLLLKLPRVGIQQG